jgi:hypothetical protein
MTERTVSSCLDESALDRVLALPEDDPARRHAGDCPRCGALLESYRLFLAPGADAEAPHVADADLRLGPWLEGAIAGARPAPRRTPSRAVPWWRLSRRPALAFAAVAALVSAIVLLPRGERGDRLRGGPGEAAPALVSARLDPDGLHLSWTPHPDADGYAAIVVDAAGNESPPIPVGAGTSAVVGPERLPSSVGPDAAVYVRIAALRHGERIATSHARAPDR